ncbi:extracellular solute-binding protein [Paenibacillus sedimenti]|uniref:Extracellular solute-binding protein n=1 Tax=Paenibacillus sedimenti TaxID=2770274 RepID=A0A926KME5_9BACL|nr:extracellular solute-binding protein [Paenibacillus sedimenti]MBD0379461.1 extracellular solute-binding protein [Paenibacillus sedimenti]
MMVVKRICAALAALVAVFMLLSSCDGASRSPEASKKEPITFTYFLNAPGDIVPEHTEIGDKITEKTGVTIQYERVVGEIEQKLGVMIAGGNYPDLIYGGDKMFLLADAKALIPLENLIEQHAPTLKKMYGPYWERIKASDGHIYALPYGVPTGQSPGWINAAFWVQKKVLKEAGYPQIKTFDQYAELLEGYYRRHPKHDGQDTIPFEILTYDLRNFTLTTAMQFLAGGPNDSRALVDPDTHELKFYQTDEMITKRYYAKLNEMFGKGLIDKEAFVMNYSQYLDKLSSGRVLGMFDQSWQFLEAQMVLKQQGKLDDMYAPLQLTFDEGMNAEYLEPATMNYGFGFGITINCKDPVRAIEFADYMASDEAQLLRNWGIRDKDYKVSDQGRFYRTEEQRAFFKDKENRRRWNGDIMYYWPGYTGTLEGGNNYDPQSQPEEKEAGYSQTDKELLKAYGVRTYEDLFNSPNLKRKYFPAWSIELSDKAKVFDQKMNDINKKYPPQMVVAASKEEFNRYWNEYVSAVHNLDVASWLDELTVKIRERQMKW